MPKNSGKLHDINYGDVSGDSVIQKDLNDAVYIGLEFPLKYTPTGFFRRTKTALQQTSHNIKNLLLTQTEERLGNPTFGCNLKRILFEPQLEDFEDVVEEEIRSAISQWLPFVSVENVEAEEEGLNSARVKVTFSINTDPASLEEVEISLGI